MIRRAHVWLVARPSGADPDTWIGDLAAAVDAGASIDVVGDDQNLLVQRGMRSASAGPPRWHAVVHDRSCSATAADLTPLTSEVRGFAVTEHAAWDRIGAADDRGATPGVKQVSFVKRRDDLTAASFRARYRNHVDVAKVHHAGIDTYVQDDVDELLTGGPPTDGISQLWFTSADDYLDRFYTGPGSAEAVREDTTAFIDFAGTFSLIATEWRRGDR